MGGLVLVLVEATDTFFWWNGKVVERKRWISHWISPSFPGNAGVVSWRCWIVGRWDLWYNLNSTKATTNNPQQVHSQNTLTTQRSGERFVWVGLLVWNLRSCPMTVMILGQFKSYFTNLELVAQRGGFFCSTQSFWVFRWHPKTELKQSNWMLSLPPDAFRHLTTGIFLPAQKMNECLQENHNTPLEHTPGNPPGQLWKESHYSLLVKV